MKISVLISSIIFVASNAFASSDACRLEALELAKAAYGNAPHQTLVRTIEADRLYVVSVGKGNAEDGEHHYAVTFRGACDQNAEVVEIGF